MFSKEIFSARLFALRKEKGISQQVLSDCLGISFHQVSKMETGQRGASLEVAYALADYFDVSLDYLTGRSECPYRLKGDEVMLLSPEEQELIRRRREGD